MRYCTHCGNQLVDDAVFCPQCGCPTENYRPNSAQNNTENLSVLAIVGFVFAFINSLVGLICSIIAYRNAVSEGNERSKNFSKTGIIISAVFIGAGVLIALIVMLIVFGVIGAAAAAGALSAAALAL